METKEIIASNIHYLRVKNGMTQQDLAEKLGYTVQAVSRWEKSKSLPDAVMLEKIATCFGVNISFLYQEKHEEALPPEAETRVKKREHVFKVILIAAVSLFLLGCASFVLIYIRIPGLPIFLWTLTFVSFLLLIVSAVFRMTAYRNFFIFWTIISFCSSFYFTFGGIIPHLVYMFYGMGVLLILLIIYFVFSAKHHHN